MILNATANKPKPLSKLDLIYDLFDEFADIRAEGVFRTEPNTKLETQLESELEQLVDMSVKKRKRAIAKMRATSPELFDTYVIANTLMRCYQQNALFPIVADGIDFKALATWQRFTQKLIKIYPLSKTNEQSLVDNATNQAFLIFMGDLLAQGHDEVVAQIHGLFRLCQRVSQHSDENKMKLEAIAHQFPACFAGLLFLDKMICKDDVVSEWKFISNMLLGILKNNNFNLPCNKLYQQKESGSLIEEQSAKLQTVFKMMGGLNEWILEGTTSKKQKACHFLFSPTIKDLICSNKASDKVSKAQTFVPTLDLTELKKGENLPHRGHEVFPITPRGKQGYTETASGQSSSLEETTKEKRKRVKK